MTIHINIKEQVLVDGSNGEILRVSCWNDLAPYHAYLKSRGHHQSAQLLLDNVFKGEKVITKMVENAQKHRDSGKL